uniref:Uncharacterized protein n=1 Tax=Avena sativa TaxID=4498 RepID=A0ACD5VP48_AVESA
MRSQSKRRHRTKTKPRRFLRPPEPEPQPQPVRERRLPVPRLRHFPDKGHLPEDYSDLVDASEIPPPYPPKWIFELMERHLPPALLRAPRGEKLEYMKRILAGHVPSPEDFARMESCIQYRKRICSSYKPLHPQLYKMDPRAFFLPLFLRAIRGNTIESFFDIIEEPTPKVYTFPMLRLAFCKMLMNEVENFQNWALREKQEINNPDSLGEPARGTTISDIGMKGMLDDLMKQFISPISKVLFPEVGGGCLDSQNSFVVPYGGDEGELSFDEDDNGMEMHVDDSDITLNVCLGKQFTGGEIYFVGRRCRNHVNSGPKHEETFLYSHVVGQALLYHGRHRHYVCPSYGLRHNMIMRCKSSLFNEVTKCKIDFPDWCIECLREHTASRQNILKP